MRIRARSGRATLLVLAASALLAATLLLLLARNAATTKPGGVQQQDLLDKVNKRAWNLNYEGHRRFQSGRINAALSCYRRALAIALKYNLTERAAAALENVAMVFESRGELDSAQHYYAMAEETALRSTDKNYLAGVYLNRCGLLQESGQVDSAITLTLLALELHREANDTYGECTALDNLSILLYEKGLEDSALAFGKAALTLARERCDRQKVESIAGRLRLQGWPGDSVAKLDLALYRLNAIPAGETSASRVNALLEAAWALRDLGNRARARRLLTSARDQYQSVGYRRGAEAAQAALVALDEDE